MAFVLLHSRFPEIAERETRTLTVLGHTDCGLPPGDYSFLEMFCDEPGCDCRRVFFCVVSAPPQQLEATVAWGWETRDFYAKWMRSEDPEAVADLKGPILNLGSPQSPLAPGILKLTQDELLRDEAFVERVKQHYALFRETVDGRRRRPPLDRTRRNPKRRRGRKRSKS